MNYVVLEMQTYADGTTTSLVDSFADKKLAEQKYHTALSYAAVSGLPMHTVMMVTSTGSHMKEEHYPDQEAGIGFSNSGPDGPYTSAWTIDDLEKKGA